MPGFQELSDVIAAFATLVDDGGVIKINDWSWDHA